MTNEQHLKAIAEGTFVIVGSGETYCSEIAPPGKLFERLKMMLFDSTTNFAAEQWQAWEEELNDPDYWHQDDDFGPVEFGSEVGEIDRIDIYRLTDLPNLSQ